VPHNNAPSNPAILSKFPRSLRSLLFSADEQHWKCRGTLDSLRGCGRKILEKRMREALEASWIGASEARDVYTTSPCLFPFWGVAFIPDRRVRPDGGFGMVEVGNRSAEKVTGASELDRYRTRLHEQWISDPGR
jgi:hypothetical protein